MLLKNSSAKAYWIDEKEISNFKDMTISPTEFSEILNKARELKGLNLHEVGALSHINDKQMLLELYETAKYVKEEIYGRRIVLFAPLYISNLCKNECVYCAFRKSNKDLKRRALDQDEITEEVRQLVRQGHKRLLLVAGESYPGDDFRYVLQSIATCYAVKEGSGEIRRINVNVAPLTVEQFQELKAAGIGTYQLFQETYHRETYATVHQGGPKSDYDWRCTAMDRAMEAGIDDVGVGVLFGLYDWRFEILALMQHIRHLEETFGVGCHTISVPRLEPASGSQLASTPPHPVSDEDFRKIVAILRLAVPYTGIIMSTRESPQMRRDTLALGVSQISAGSRINPGGYHEEEDFHASQFQLGDHRSLSEVIQDLSELGYIPSFCTGCYRVGRTGQDFMDMAKPGLIKAKCAPNALSTFLEYLLDYAPEEVLQVGEKTIAEELIQMDAKTQKVAQRMLEKVRAGKRDVFC
jgi:2-iminoacetate synthase